MKRSLAIALLLLSAVPALAQPASEGAKKRRPLPVAQPVTPAMAVRPMMQKTKNRAVTSMVASPVR